MKYEFKPCPDCGCNHQPVIDRGVSVSPFSGIEIPKIYAYCPKCHWGTKTYDNEEECVEFWNNALVVDELSKSEFDNLYDEKVPDDIKEIVDLGFLTKREALIKCRLTLDDYQPKGGIIGSVMKKLGLARRS